jgi:hypothetical protein
MADNVAGGVSLRALREDDLPTMFEIQLDDTAQRLAAFTDKTARDRDAYLRLSPKELPSYVGQRCLDSSAGAEPPYPCLGRLRSG